MIEISPQVKKSIVSRILSDLAPKASLVHLKVGLTMIGGGLLSLLFCGQFGVGITGFAIRFNEDLHHTNGIVCALSCGALFAIVPLISLRLICSGVQFQAIMRKHLPIIMTWFAAAGLLLALIGEVGDDFIYVLTWFIAAIVIYQAGGYLIREVEKTVHKWDHMPQA